MTRFRKWLAGRVECLAVWFESPPMWWRVVMIVGLFAGLGIIALAIERGWRPHVLYFALYFALISWFSASRSNRRLRRDNAYLADRLARVEPVPITILDGLGRDINHLDDAEETSRPSSAA